MRLKFAREWELGAAIGGGGFGKVYEAKPVDGDNARYVIKMVPKEPGAQRELLFEKLDGVQNVVPIVDTGETDDSWVIVMPRADKSLQDHIAETGQPFDAAAVIPILADIAIALADLDGKVVHRDLKPGNVLLLNGRWCLADFGISRYAEATTAQDTRKHALSPPYAGPERWRSERATGATDVYSLGVIGFELLSGALPFAGPDISDFRDQHLHVDAPPLRNVPSALGALISECLFKSPGARPGAQNIVARLGSAARAPASPGLARLQQANMQIVAEKSEGGRIASVAQSEAERRKDLLQAATASFQRIGEQLKETIKEHAPQASIRIARNGSWNADLKSASLVFSMVERTDSNIWGGWEAPAIDVIGYGSIEVSIPRNRYDYEGRSHSLWFCDAKEAGRYGWFEAAFMITPGMRLSYPKAPFALDPGEEAAKALWSGMAEFQMAWPFTQVIVGELDEFIDRWIGWFAQAAEGSLNHPSMMPERDAQGSWRR